MFYRRYIFKWWISHCYVSLPECNPGCIYSSSPQIFPASNHAIGQALDSCKLRIACRRSGGNASTKKNKNPRKVQQHTPISHTPGNSWQAFFLSSCFYRISCGSELLQKPHLSPAPSIGVMLFHPLAGCTVTHLDLALLYPEALGRNTHHVMERVTNKKVLLEILGTYPGWKL